METTITIPIDTETARIYNEASDEERRKLRLIMSLWIRDFTRSRRPLDVIMDEISHKAQVRGLTPEILESLLNGE